MIHTLTGLKRVLGFIPAEPTDGDFVAVGFPVRDQKRNRGYYIYMEKHGVTLGVIERKGSTAKLTVYGYLDYDFPLTKSYIMNPLEYADEFYDSEVDLTEFGYDGDDWTSLFYNSSQVEVLYPYGCVWTSVLSSPAEGAQQLKLWPHYVKSGGRTDAYLVNSFWTDPDDLCEPWLEQ